jgi:hypothetical protein
MAESYRRCNEWSRLVCRAAVSRAQSARAKRNVTRDWLCSILPIAYVLRVCSRHFRTVVTLTTYAPSIGRIWRSCIFSLDKTEPSIGLTVFCAGLYVVTISDAVSTSRVEIFVAAISPERAADFNSSPRGLYTTFCAHT